MPEKGFKRLALGEEVRLRGAYIIRCTGVEKDADGRVTLLRCSYDPETRSGMPGSERKVKGVIHWVSAPHAISAPVRLYDRLFTQAQPDAGGRDFLGALNPASKKIVSARLEPSMRDAQPDQKFQFERHGYFVADLADHAP